MKDFFGVELTIGDVVAFNPPRYKGLSRGVVTKFTPQMVEVEYNHQGRLYLTKVYPRDTAKRPVPQVVVQTVVHDPYDNSIGGPNDYAYGC